jgi:hypothetical protein
MLTFVMFWVVYFVISVLCGAKVAYFVMVPVSFVLLAIGVSKLLAAMTMKEFAKFAEKNRDKFDDAIVVEARGLDR